jgi:hypothetical protein
MIANVGAPIEMGLYESLDTRDLKELAVFGGCKRHRLTEHWPKRTAKPIVRRNVKPDFLSIQDRRVEFAPHQISQHYLLPGTLNFQIGGKSVRELHDPMIEKWRAHLDRMSHAGAIDLSQNIVREIVFLIESQKPLQIGARAGQFVENGVKRRRFGRL